MKLSRKEKWRLILEAFITGSVVLLLYFAAFVILQWIVTTFNSFFYSMGFLGDIFLQFQANEYIIGTPFIVFLLAVIAGVFIYWRLKRRYRQYELQHIINELHYIAKGDYTHRITGQYGEDMKKVVESIHVLVDSTIEAMEEERRIEQSKDELITNVSHDIRTPLTSIIGYLGLIEENRYSDLEEVQKFTHTAYEKAKQMKILVDDLFEYTKVRQTTTPIQIVSFDMIQLLEQLAADFELEAAKKEMEIIVKSSVPTLKMQGDTEKLVRVFNNLLTNALKYGKNGHYIEMIVHAERTKVNIEVNNDGTNLPAEAIHQLFERFYRAEESRSQETGGTGLGLAIAQSIIELHGGTIQAKSENGWTKFVIELPLRPQKQLKEK
ncbi:sensor histidine kinase [Lacticigenium naphthae]|uniref:sensor histidine kinase n=1 Tax=Lacticigenium naphthae TaxID=515351 RepID=UPI00041A2222|nr:HAMP domain-containing sensor histidine kinase [Lacticigenium naphthae]